MNCGRWTFWVHAPFLIGLALASVASVYLPRVRLAVEQPRTYRIDPARSKLEINVFKAGLLKAFGHDHLIAVKMYDGEVQVTPNSLEQGQVTLQLVTDSFTVLDPDLKQEDREKVQKDMKSDKVLDVAKYPQITFVSTRVSDVKPATDGFRLTLTGNLTLHGVAHPASIPVQVSLSDDLLRARGEYKLKQTDFQIKPISVFGVSVKNEVRIVVDVTARRER